MLAVAVLVAVTFGSFALMATKFSSQCTSPFTPAGVANPPLAGTVGQAATLYWRWLKGIPGGASFRAVCGGDPLQKVGPAFARTGLLLTATAILVLGFSLLLGTFAATRAGSPPDVLVRGFSYAAWAVPPFLLALVLQSAFRSSGLHWFELSGWPGQCFAFTQGCSSPHGVHYVVEIVRHLVLPAVALSVAFIGLHSRYLRSSLLVALNAPYTTTARAKGLPERRVVVVHALRNSLATFLNAFLLDLGAIFGAALAVDWVFGLNGVGSLLVTDLAGVGGGDGPRYLDPYAIETLLGTAALVVLLASVVAELAVASLDPRARLT